MQAFTQLQVWQRAHTLVLTVYAETARFPRAERFGIVTQMRRAAVSVAANLAEGCARTTDQDFARFVVQAFGSASEVEYFLLLARDLGLMSAARHRELTGCVSDVKRMLASLIKTLRAATRPQSRRPAADG